MNDFTQIVKDALEYYDDNTMKYYDKTMTFKYYTITKEDNTIAFFGADKKKIFETEYEVIGKYIPYQSLWIWGWSSGELNKELVATSRKVLNYALDLDKENILLKTSLITSRYQISSYIQTDMHVALTSFLSKRPFVYKLEYYGEYFSDTNKASDNAETRKTNNVDYSDDEQKYIFKISHKKDPVVTYYIVLKND